MTNREAHEEAAGMGLEEAFFRFNKIDPDAPAERVALKDAVECLETFGIGMAAEAKSTATAPLRTRQCEIRSTAIFTVLDILDQYRKALEKFGVTFADNGLIRMIPRHPPLSPEDESTMKALRDVLDAAMEDAVQALPSVEDAKRWKADQSGYFISPELEERVAKFMSDYAMEVLVRSGYFDGRDSKGE